MTTKNRRLRTVILSAMVALLVATALAFTVSAHTAAPAHGAMLHVVNVPDSGKPNTNIIIVNGKEVFRPDRIACKQVQNEVCHTITNKTNEAQDIYTHGGFVFTLPAHSSSGIIYGKAGTYTYELKENPEAKVTIIVSM